MNVSSTTTQRSTKTKSAIPHPSEDASYSSLFECQRHHQQQQYVKNQRFKGNPFSENFMAIDGPITDNFGGEGSIRSSSSMGSVHGNTESFSPSSLEGQAPNGLQDVKAKEVILVSMAFMLLAFSVTLFFKNWKKNYWDITQLPYYANCYENGVPAQIGVDTGLVPAGVRPTSSFSLSGMHASTSRVMNAPSLSSTFYANQHLDEDLDEELYFLDEDDIQEFEGGYHGTRPHIMDDMEAMEDEGALQQYSKVDGYRSLSFKDPSTNNTTKAQFYSKRHYQSAPQSNLDSSFENAPTTAASTSATSPPPGSTSASKANTSASMRVVQNPTDVVTTTMANSGVVFSEDERSHVYQSGSFKDHLRSNTSKSVYNDRRSNSAKSRNRSGAGNGESSIPPGGGGGTGPNLVSPNKNNPRVSPSIFDVACKLSRSHSARYHRNKSWNFDSSGGGGATAGAIAPNPTAGGSPSPGRSLRFKSMSGKYPSAPTAASRRATTFRYRQASSTGSAGGPGGAFYYTGASSSGSSKLSKHSSFMRSSKSSSSGGGITAGGPNASVATPPQTSSIEEEETTSFIAQTQPLPSQQQIYPRNRVFTGGSYVHYRDFGVDPNHRAPFMLRRCKSTYAGRQAGSYRTRTTMSRPPGMMTGAIVGQRKTAVLHTRIPCEPGNQSLIYPSTAAFSGGGGATVGGGRPVHIIGTTTSVVSNRPAPTSILTSSPREARMVRHATITSSTHPCVIDHVGVSASSVTGHHVGASASPLNEIPASSLKAPKDMQNSKGSSSSTSNSQDRPSSTKISFSSEVDVLEDKDEDDEENDLQLEIAEDAKNMEENILKNSKVLIKDEENIVLENFNEKIKK